MTDRQRQAEEAARRNKRAWDELYMKTEQMVWGRLPIGFLQEFLGYLNPPLTASSHALDAGSGEGRNLQPIIDTGASVAVCDSSRGALRKLRSLFEGVVPTAQCDLSALPYADARFDFVLMTDVVETLPLPEQALSEVHRVLRAGGQFLCNIPGGTDPISSDGMEALGGAAYLYQGSYFYQFFETDSAATMIRRAGFEVVRAESRLWREDAHPEFRSYAHDHISNVFLCRKVG